MIILLLNIDCQLKIKDFEVHLKKLLLDNNHSISEALCKISHKFRVQTSFFLT